MIMYIEVSQQYIYIRVQMGIETSSNKLIKQRHKKFLQVFKNNYKIASQLNDQIFGAGVLYMNINNNTVQVLQKHLSLTSESEIEKVVKTMEMRITKPHPNLIRIYSIQYLEQTQFCGGGHSVKIYTEYLQKNLKTELGKRRKNGSFLSEQLLLRITVSLLNGITYLHQENTFHGQIRAQTVLVDGSYHLKLVERALLNPSNWEIGLTMGSYKILKGRGVLLSPCILECLNQKTTQMANYDPFKADIFAIGMILLQCCSLKKAEDFYDYQSLTVKQNDITMTIYQCRTKYSSRLMNVVQKMLQFDDEVRPKAKVLMQQMQIISGDTIRQMNTTLNQSFLSQTIRSYL